MGGGGSMAAANQSLKYNRSQLSKRNNRKSFEGSYAKIKLEGFPKASKSELRLLREKLQKEKQIRNKKTFIVFLLLVSTLIAITLTLIKILENQ